MISVRVAVAAAIAASSLLLAAPTSWSAPAAATPECFDPALGDKAFEKAQAQAEEEGSPLPELCRESAETTEDAEPTTTEPISTEPEPTTTESTTTEPESTTQPAPPVAPTTTEPAPTTTAPAPPVAPTTTEPASTSTEPTTTEPAPPVTPTTTEPAPTTTAPATPAEVQAQTTVEPAPTTTAPATTEATSTPQEEEPAAPQKAPTTTGEAAPTSAPEAAPETTVSAEPEATTTAPQSADAPAVAELQTESESLRISSSSVVAASVEPGDTFAGTMQVTVTDTRETDLGWVARVSMPGFVGVDSDATFQPARATYKAGDTACSKSTGVQPLAAEAVSVQFAEGTCSASWQADIRIAVPTMGVATGNYTSVITHSVL